MTGRSPESITFGPALGEAARGEREATGEFRFVPGDGLWRNGHVVPLPPRAIGVLTALLSTPGVVVSKRTLMDAVWPGTFVTESSLLEAIGLLRDTLGDDRKNPAYIQTVHRRGYRFIGDISASALAPVATVAPVAPVESFFSGPQWRPIVAACVTYVIATICVAIVFAVLGRPRPESHAADLSIDGPRFAIAHSGEVVYVPAMGVPVAPAWTPSGLEIAFAFSKAGPFNVAGDGVDGTPLLARRGHMFPTSWSPDNTRLAFTDHQPLTGADIWILDLRTRTSRPLARTWFDETWARFSPDGRQIAYMSNETGRWEVYVRPVDGNGRPTRVSTQGGAWPSWSSDGKTVLFSTGEAMRGSGEMRAMLEWFADLAAHAGPG